jgi:hypothetical protein
MAVITYLSQVEIMSLSFGKKSSPGVSQSAQAHTGAAPPSQSSQTSAAPKFNWLKTGEAAKQAQKVEEMRQQQAKEAANRMRRFRLKDGKEARITFLNGLIDKDGILEIPKWYEHEVQVNGFYKKFTCTAEVEQDVPCPLCAANDKPDYVGCATIINHTPYIIQNGENAGKTIENQRQLFVGKLGTIAGLSKIAIKRGGLKGLTMDVSRTGDKKPNVGDVFDVVDQVTNWNQFRAKYNLKPEDIEPANLYEENPYIPAADLIALGIGKALGGPGTGAQKATGAMKEQL